MKPKTSPWYMGECDWCTHTGSVMASGGDSAMCWRCASIGTEWARLHANKPYVILDRRDTYVGMPSWML